MGMTECKGYDYLSYRQWLEELCRKYTFLNAFTIGKSCLGRDIVALSIGKTNEYALITAAFHGSEYITSTVLMFFIEELCAALRTNGSLAGFDVRKALFGRGIIFVPCVNVDGCEIAMHGLSAAGQFASFVAKLAKNDYCHWNANARGVDINHNFDADWDALHEKEQQSGIFGPAPTRFGGFRAESEPETVALTKLCRSKRIRHAVALHSQGEVIYWSYGEKIPPRSVKMAEIMATSSGYELSSPEGLAVGGGFKDWFISEFNRPAFTVEMGLGSNPLPIDTALNIYTRLRELLMLVSIM